MKDDSNHRVLSGNTGCCHGSVMAACAQWKNFAALKVPQANEYLMDFDFSEIIWVDVWITRILRSAESLI